jgi:hypothetical protein
MSKPSCHKNTKFRRICIHLNIEDSGVSDLDSAIIIVAGDTEAYVSLARNLGDAKIL